MKTEIWRQLERRIINGVYPLRRLLGTSDHSAVFLTEYRAENIPEVAIKLIPADTSQAQAQLVLWGTAATLSHPNLMRLYDVGRWQLGSRVFLYVVMENAEQTLADILPKRALTGDEVGELLAPTLDALGFLHRNYLVHGQLKPSNFLVVNDQLKLASDTIRPIGNSLAGMATASPYDPPELKEGTISPAGDVWGLGITLVESLTQRTLDWRDDRSETASLLAAVPPPFIDTVFKCLSRNPTHRPTINELEAQYKSAPPPEAEAPPVLQPPAQEAAHETASSPGKTSKTTPWLSVITLIVLAGVAVWIGLRLVRQQPPNGGQSASNISQADSRRADASAMSARQTSAAAATPPPADAARNAEISRSGEVARSAEAPAATTAAASAAPAAAATASAAADHSASSAPPADRNVGTPDGAVVRPERTGATADGTTARSDHVGTTPDSTGASPDRAGITPDNAAARGGRTVTPLDRADSTHSVGTLADADRAAVGRTLGARAETDHGVVDRPPGASSDADRPIAKPALASYNEVTSASRTDAPTTHAASPVAQGTVASTVSQSLVAPTPRATPAPAVAQAAVTSPGVLHQVMPVVPPAIRAKIRGTVKVTVRVLIDPSGSVVGQMFENAGPSRYFARLAGDAAEGWKFSPSGGRGPRVWQLHFEFTRGGDTVSSTAAQ